MSAPEDYPGEVIKEEIWRNIEGNELSDKPARVADKIMAALTAAGYVVVRTPPSGACRNCGHSKHLHDDPEVGRCYHGIDDDDAAPCNCTAYEPVRAAAGLGG